MSFWNLSGWKEGVLDWKDCHFGTPLESTYIGKTLERDLLIDSMNRRNDYSNQGPNGWSWSLIIINLDKRKGLEHGETGKS